MHLTRLRKAVLVLSLVAAAAVTLVSVAGSVAAARNDVDAVYNTSGKTLKAQTLKRFFGYPDHRAGGPGLTDPSCYYDAQTGACIVVGLTLELGNQGNFTGENHVDIA